MKIIKAGIKHIDELTELFDLYRQFYKKKSDKDSARKFLTQRIKRNESVIFLCHDEYGTAIGFTQLYPYFTSVGMRRAWILNDMFVKKENRKLGAGEKLIESVRKFAEKTSSGFVMLETQKTNKNACRLYEKMGFKPDRERRYYYLEI
ncbi:MAG: GNAT family N-acetyltransferase [Ignavibacteria bacterium]|nr:GNAT family N-acetyltransferase [Ignavibacteria bacterium]